MNMISELISKLEDITYKYGYPNCGESDAIEHDTILEAIDTIKALSANVEELDKAQYELFMAYKGKKLHDEWIPSSERLPDKREDDGLSNDVLITNGESVTCGHYYYLTNKWYSSGIVFNCVAWMPLPSPYKEN